MSNDLTVRRLNRLAQCGETCFGSCERLRLLMRRAALLEHTVADGTSTSESEAMSLAAIHHHIEAVQGCLGISSKTLQKSRWKYRQDR